MCPRVPESGAGHRPQTYAESVTTNTASSAEPGNRRILLVEDEQTIADVVRDYLLQAGFQVDMAGDGFTALSWQRPANPIW